MIKRLLALSFTLAACTEPQTAPDATPAPEIKDALIEQAARTITTTTSTATRAADTPDTPDVPDEEPDDSGPIDAVPLKKPTCKDAPAWVSSPICKRDGDVFAVGAVAKIRNPSLARDAAANRARRLLSDKRIGLASKKPGLNGSEIVEVSKCRGTWYALVKVAEDELGGADLPSCSF